MSKLAAKVRVAAVQMVSAPEVPANLEAAGRLIAEAAAAGAKLVSLPEYFCILGRHESDKVKVREKEGAGPIQDFLAGAASRHRVWLVGGTLPLESGDANKVRNACLVFDVTPQPALAYVQLWGFRTPAELAADTLTLLAEVPTPVEAGALTTGVFEARRF